MSDLRSQVSGPGRPALIGLGVLLGVIGVLVSVVPLAAAAIAAGVLSVGLVYRVPAHRLAEPVLVAALVLAATEQWISGFPISPAMEYFVAATDGLVAILVLLIPLMIADALRGEQRAYVLPVADAFVPVTLFVVFAVLAVIAHPVTPLEALYWFRVNFRFVILGVATALVVLKRPEVVRRLALTVIAIASFQAVVGVIEFIGGRRVAKLFWPGGGIVGGVDTFKTIGNRVVTGTFGHYNPLGIYLVLALCLLVGMRALIDPEENKRWPFMLAGLFMFVVVLTQSRQSIAAMFLAGTVVAIAIGGRMRRVVLATGAMIIIAFLVVLAIGNPHAEDVVERFEQLTSREYWAVTSKTRGFVLSNALPAALEYDPVLGTGPGSFQKSVTGQVPVGTRRLGYTQDAVKFVVDVGVAASGIQVGLMGLFAMAWLFWVQVTRSLRLLRSRTAWRGLAVASLGVVVTVALTSFASSPLVFKPTSSVFWVVFGMLAARSVVEGAPDRPNAHDAGTDAIATER